MKIGVSSFQSVLAANAGPPTSAYHFKHRQLARSVLIRSFRLSGQRTDRTCSKTCQRESTVSSSYLPTVSSLSRSIGYTNSNKNFPHSNQLKVNVTKLAREPFQNFLATCPEFESQLKETIVSTQWSSLELISIHYMSFYGLLHSIYYRHFLEPT